MPNPESHTTADDTRIAALFERHRVCVLIPTYNNAGTLSAVLDDVLTYTRHLIVVNDGSTDGTREILRGFPDVHLVDYAVNRGKGYALKTGLRAARAQGYAYALVMDSDGQHYASDLHCFLEKLEEVPGALIVGARNMQVDHVPQKSSFGNRFSNFWYWVNTGIRMPDTQSGFRLYPLAPLAGKKYVTGKYEFEIEILVRAAWSGVPVIWVPISVYYPPAEERVSHFRPFKDFTRISILNTFLVLISVLYIKPRDLLRMIFSRDGWRRIFRAVFVHPEESNLRKASSVGFGVFMGIVPVWGLQLAIGIPLAVLFRLNKALFLLAANISVFPITALWLVASLMTGKFLLGDPFYMPGREHLTIEAMKHEGVSFFLGGSVLAVVMGLVSFGLTYCLLFLSGRRRRKALR